jgi:hypothetical protein
MPLILCDLIHNMRNDIFLQYRWHFGFSEYKN